MDQEEIQKSIMERFNNLQPEIQAIIMDPNYDKGLIEIGQRYELKPEELSVLELNTTMVLLGQIHPDEYKKELSDDLKISKEKLNAIVKDVNEKVFKDIINIIRKNFSGDEKEDKILSDLPDSYYEEGYFSKLPKEVQDAVRESDYRTKLYNIAKEKDFSIDQMQGLEEITNKVLLNVIHPDKYEEELKAKLGLEASVVSEIVNKVNEDILKNIREILRKHWEENKGIKVESDDEVPTPPYLISKVEIPKVIPSITPKPTEQTPKTESVIYKNAGIEMMTDEPEKNDVMKNIINSKLSAPTVSKPVASDQSIPKIKTPPVHSASLTQSAPPSEKPHDPYHEAV